MGARLLVVDDSPTIRKLIELTLRGTEWTVSFASSGLDGIKSASASPPDLIVLDYVLPDMRGLDVCARLAGEAATRNVPVVVITAKSDEVRAQFEPFASVIACLPKPFTGDQLKKIAAAALSHRAPEAAPASTRETFSHEQREAAAQLLFTRLRGALASIPQWVGAMGNAPAPVYFAKKLLTAERVDALLEGLLPLYRDVLASHAARSALHDADAAAISGELRSWPLADLLNFFAASGRTGELTVTRDDRTLITYWRSGEVVLATSRDPEEYLRGARLGRPLPSALARGKAEQRANGRPVFVTLAEEGVELPAPLGDLLHRQGRRLMLEANDACWSTFKWRDLAALPLYVEAYGRHVSTARNTLGFGALLHDGNPPPASSPEQLSLERLRRAPAATSVAEDAVVDRARGFTDRIRRFDLEASERRVLAALDGFHSVGDVAARISLPIAEVRVILARLTEVGLVTEPSLQDRRETPSSGRPVLILEPDVDGFQRPLEALLRDRAIDAPVMSLAEEHDIVGAIRRERPRLVILNAAVTNDTLEDTARAVRATSDLSDVSLVAVLESEGATDAAALRAAGFDAVFVKPVPYADLERLID